MKERPILFSGAMVRAILGGSKTQTRRVIKTPGSKTLADIRRNPDNDAWYKDHVWSMRNRGGMWGDYTHMRFMQFCPYGQPGDRLWVRETWAHDAASVEACRVVHEDAMGGSPYGPYYRATESAPETLRWIPSIHMPRWASRILLEIVSVRVERLHDISEADAIAEGIERMPCAVPDTKLWRNYTPDNGWTPNLCIPENSFRSLWALINGEDGWDANPWVWVVEFKRVTP